MDVSKIPFLFRLSSLTDFPFLSWIDLCSALVSQSVSPILTHVPA